LKTVHVISHTHWDREWYASFERFRRRLVFLFDELLEVLEAGPEYNVFTLDGTCSLIDDYLEIRPENRERLARLTASGRIVLGPWYTMPDEFLVSGESLIRNLVYGMKMAKDWGAAPMKCGYLPDVFGHAPQLPQILGQLGIGSALLYRGIGDFPKDLFDWKAPDGSTALVFKLDAERSYSSFYFALRWPFDGRPRTDDEALERARKLVEHLAAHSDSDALLSMDGVDHIELDREVPALLAMLNSKMDGVRFKQSTIEEYEAEIRRKAPKLTTLEGPLYQQGRRGVNNQVLKNVLSSILPVKQSNDTSETSLLRWAEPLEAVVSLAAAPRNRAFLEHAWRILFQNHAHDSICGCSISKVHRDNLNRFEQVKEICSDIIDDNLSSIAFGVSISRPAGSLPAYLIWNPIPEERQAIVKVDISLPRGESFNPVIRDENGMELAWQVLDVKRNVETTIIEYRRLPRGRQLDVWQVALALRLPGFGYTTITVENKINGTFKPGDYSWPVWHAPVRHSGSMASGVQTWDNGYVELSIAPDRNILVRRSGLAVDPSPLFFFEDEGDVGDGWIWRKPRIDGRIQSTVTSCTVVDDGPLCLRLAVVCRLRLPVGIDSTEDSRTVETRDVDIVVRLTLAREEPLVGIEVDFDNTCVGHRLRIAFPIPFTPSRMTTATPFAMTDWPLQADTPSDAQEIPSAVVPNQGLALVRGLETSVAVINHGLYECELVSYSATGASAKKMAAGMLYLTALRSFEHEVGQGRTGDLSRMLGPHHLELAYSLVDSRMSDGHLYNRAQAWKAGTKNIELPPPAKPSQPVLFDKPLPSSASFLALSGGTIAATSIQAHPQGGWLIRLCNMEEQAQSLEIKTFLPVLKVTEVEPDGLATCISPSVKISLREGKVHVVVPSRRFVTLWLVFSN